MDGGMMESVQAEAGRLIERARAVGRAEGVAALEAATDRHRVAEAVLRVIAGSAASAAQSLGFAPGASKALANTASFYRDMAESFRVAGPDDEPTLLDAEGVAKAFHRTYEALAPDHGYETREESRTDWADVPEENRGLMVATAGALIEQGVVRPGPAPLEPAPKPEPEKGGKKA